MKTKGGLKFTGFLIVFGVVAYLVFIGNAIRSSSAIQKVDSVTIFKDSVQKNPFSNIYQKVNIEKMKKETELLNKP